jgi:hypothetical protein
LNSAAFEFQSRESCEHAEYALDFDRDDKINRQKVSYVAKHFGDQICLPEDFR